GAEPEGPGAIFEDRVGFIVRQSVRGSVAFNLAFAVLDQPVPRAEPQHAAPVTVHGVDDSLLDVGAESLSFYREPLVFEGEEVSVRPYPEAAVCIFIKRRRAAETIMAEARFGADVERVICEGSVPEPMQPFTPDPEIAGAVFQHRVKALASQSVSLGVRLDDVAVETNEAAIVGPGPQCVLAV